MDQVTLILDLDGYRLKLGQFIVRELGWCTIRGENDSFFLFTDEIQRSELQRPTNRQLRVSAYSRVTLRSLLQRSRFAAKRDRKCHSCALQRWNHCLQRWLS